MSESQELSPQAVVSKPVVDVLDEQTALLRSIDAKVDGKADKSDLVDLVSKVNDHGSRIVSLEETRMFSRRLMAAGGVLLMAGATIIGSLIATHAL